VATVGSPLREARRCLLRRLPVPHAGGGPGGAYAWCPPRRAVRAGRGRRLRRGRGGVPSRGGDTPDRGVPCRAAPPDRIGASRAPSTASRSPSPRGGGDSRSRHFISSPVGGGGPRRGGGGTRRDTDFADL